MNVRFVLGLAGTGKTRWCLDQVVSSLRAAPLDGNIFWLAPRQATFGVQRMLAESSDIGGYFQAQVVSFEDLGQVILSECGGASTPQVTSLGRRMILGNLLRKHAGQLQFFHSVAHQPGMAAELDVTFDELERCGLDVQSIQPLQTDFPPALVAKLHDLRLIYGEYSKFLGRDRLDPNRRQKEALKRISQSASLRGADIYVDSFYDFTLFERQVLAALGEVCRSLAITLIIDPQSAIVTNPRNFADEMGVFHRCERTFALLSHIFGEKLVQLSEPVICATPHRFVGRGLLEIQKDDQTAIAPGSAIEMEIATDRRGEVDAAARWIRTRVAGGMRYRDIAVMMRSDDEYRELIAASFAEHGIPFFADRRRTAAHHPLLRLIRAALAVARTNWSHDAVMAVIKTNLLGLSGEEVDSGEDVDALENYVLAHDIRHRAWLSDAAWNIAGRSGEDSVRINELRTKVVAHLKEFTGAIPVNGEINVRDLAVSIFKLLENIGVRARIVKWMEHAEKAGHLEERGEHERVWDELVKLFDELVELFGQEKITLADFSAILDAALESFSLALAPPTVDQVLVGPVDRTRTGNVKACVFLGLAEGQFPRRGKEGTVFSDADRRSMARSNIDLDPDTERQLLDEKFLAYIAFSRASDNLLLTRSVADDRGRAIGSSPFWNDLILRGLTPRAAERESDFSLQSIATPRQLLVALMQWVREGGANGPMAQVYQWLATTDHCPPAIDTIRYHSWKSLSYNNDAVLDPARAKKIFPSPLKTTFAKLESFRSCPYQHFARWGLHLREREHREIRPMDLSEFYHDSLNRLVLDLIKTKSTWHQLDQAKALGRIAEFTGQVANEFRGALMHSTGRNRYLLGHIQRNLGSVVAAQRAAAARGHFDPAWGDVRFGGDGDRLGPLEISGSGGNLVHLRGKIDRIDVMPHGAACIIDYTLKAGRPDAAEIYYGLRLKLLASLLVLESAGQHLGGHGRLTPAATFCVQLLRANGRQSPDEAMSPADEKFHLRPKPRGIFDKRYLRNLDREYSSGLSDVVSAMVRQDGELGMVDSNDACGEREFAALMKHMRRRIGELADRVISGEIDIRPCRVGDWTPCSACEFRAVCRFEPRPGGYLDLPPMGRQEMLTRVVEENP